MTEQDKYILIDTPELKAMFAPKQAADEIKIGNDWMGSAKSDNIFGRDSTYRRLRARAWIKISDRTVQWPAWLGNEAGAVWASDSSSYPSYLSIYTVWQPAPAAPPVDEDMEWKMVAADHFLGNCSKAMDKDALILLFNEAVKVGRDYARTKSKPQAGD